MRKKKILVCDDDPSQRNKLNEYLNQHYEIILLDNYEYLVDKVEENSPVHLVILDLGFKGEMVGQTVLPELYERFPKLKVMIYSSLLDKKDKTEELSNLLRQINHAQIGGYASPTDKKARLVIQVNQITGTSEWIKNDQIWILHISDPQFGGKGLADDSKTLTNKIWDCLKNYKRSRVNQIDVADEGYFDYPDLAVITGDLTEKARPSEFETVGQFIEDLTELMVTENNQFAGFLSSGNVIFIPGNHDINWDISLARSIFRSKLKNDQPKDGDEQPQKKTERYDEKAEQPKANLELKKNELNKELDYLSEYAWLPYAHFSRQFDQLPWHINPGYEIVDLSHELHLILVKLNTSLWEVHHQEQNPVVPQKIFTSIREELDEKYDPERRSTRILLAHHTLEPEASRENKLRLKESEQILNTISHECGFSLVLTGHVHKRSVSMIETNHQNRTLHHIGAGTLRSDDSSKYDHPQFNLIRLFDLSPDSNKFEKLAVYTFSFDGNIYRINPITNVGNQDYRSYQIQYY